MAGLFRGLRQASIGGHQLSVRFETDLKSIAEHFSNRALQLIREYLSFGNEEVTNLRKQLKEQHAQLLQVGARRAPTGHRPLSANQRSCPFLAAQRNQTKTTAARGKVDAARAATYLRKDAIRGGVQKQTC